MKSQPSNQVASRGVRRRGRRGRKARGLPLTPSMAAKVFTTRLVFNNTCTDTEAAALAGVTHRFRLNSVYDVDTALGSTSTPYFSEYAALYNNYRVLRAHVNVTGLITNGASTGAYQVSMFPERIYALPPGAFAWNVMPYGKTTIVGSAISGGLYKVVLDREYDLAAVCGITKSQFMNEADFSALCTANPVKDINLIVATVGLSGAVAASFTYSIRVAFEVQFFNPTHPST